MGAALPESLGPVPGVRETDGALPLSRPVASAPSGPHQNGIPNDRRQHPFLDPRGRRFRL